MKDIQSTLGLEQQDVVIKREIVVIIFLLIIKFNSWGRWCQQFYDLFPNFRQKYRESSLTVEYEDVVTIFNSSSQHLNKRNLQSQL